MTAGAGFPAGPVERSNLRAADTDRDRAVEFINTAYMEGRLSKDEHEVRLAHAMSASTYADLDQLVHDLPAAHAPDVTLAANTNGLALASLGCGVGQLMFGPLATIPAVVLGHMARHQIRRTGEQGAGLALAGLILGWAGVILSVVAVVVVVILIADAARAIP